jgi:hypothetical protein
MTARPAALALVLALGAVPAAAHAQGQLALDHIPDVDLYEAIWPLGYSFEGKPQLVGTVGLGAGDVDGNRSAVVALEVAAGLETDTVLAVARSELAGWGATRRDLALLRGRHRALVQLKTGEDLGLVVALGGTLDHGVPRGLAPIRLGAGPRSAADVRGEVMWFMDPDDDESFAFAVRGDAGRVDWAGDRGSNRRALTLAFGYAPNDDELPRGMLDLVRGRVEHTRVEMPVALAAVGGGRGTADVRRVDVGLGVHDLTLHIDHELAAVIVADLGWSWLQADTLGGVLADTLFRLDLGAGFKLRDRRKARLMNVGLGIAREPTHTADGQRLVSDWRFELAGAIENRRLVLGARGGIAWLRRLDGGPSPADPLIRYGSQVEAFAKLGAGLELGGYHRASFEPAGDDPWATSRRWDIEAGLLIRLRTDTAARAAR